MQHDFFALDAWSGQKLWKYTKDYAVSSTPVLANGTVYVAGDFVSTRNPDFFRGGVAIALRSNIVSVPSGSPLLP